MVQNDKNNLEEQEVLDNKLVEGEIESIWDIESMENEKLLDDLKDDLKEDWEEIVNLSFLVEKLKDTLAVVTADFENFKKRTDRDKQDMIFFLKSDIFKKILPRLDDLERIIKNTPKEMQTWPLFEWIVVLEKNFKKDIVSLWVESFDSIWSELDLDKHDVMTQIPWKEWIILDEFEKWYMLSWRVLRHAKVVAWNWNWNWN